MRRFIVVGSRAKTTPDFTPKDLCGGAGRWDVLIRCVNSTFFLSHGLRKNVELYLVLLGGSDPPKTIRFWGPGLRSLNPDEYSTSTLVLKALAIDVSHGESPSTPGISVSKRGFSDVVKGCMEDSMVFYLHEEGVDIRRADFPGGEQDRDMGFLTFVLGDDTGLSPEDEELLKELGCTRLSVGPTMLHGEHCITLVHNELDRKYLLMGEE